MQFDFLKATNRYGRQLQARSHASTLTIHSTTQLIHYARLYACIDFTWVGIDCIAISIGQKPGICQIVLQHTQTISLWVQGLCCAGPRCWESPAHRRTTFCLPSVTTYIANKNADPPSPNTPPPSHVAKSACHHLAPVC